MNLKDDECFKDGSMTPKPQSHNVPRGTWYGRPFMKDLFNSIKSQSL